jgi:hypothetical protein
MSFPVRVKENIASSNVLGTSDVGFWIDLCLKNAMYRNQRSIMKAPSLTTASAVTRVAHAVARE